MREGYKPLVAITLGDPSGIGPEVTVKSLLQPQVIKSFTPLVLGSVSIIQRELHNLGARLPLEKVSSPKEVNPDKPSIYVLDMENIHPDDAVPGQISARAGKASVEWVLKAGELALARQVDAIVTAPINKEACQAAGYTKVGHMELLQELASAPQVATMLLVGPLRNVHLTTHRSLRQACDYVTRNGILDKLRLTQEFFSLYGMPDVRIGVAALNPHGGENGLMGREEIDEIAPAIKDARTHGIDAIGPIPADSIFFKAMQGDLDAILVMYHDQGHIPIKVYDFHRSVTTNLGLPFIRTSVDHGTAFDISGMGKADATSMVEALKLAITMSGQRRLP